MLQDIEKLSFSKPLACRFRFVPIRNPHFQVCSDWFLVRSSPQQTKPKKGPKRKVHEFLLFCEFWCFFSRKTSTIHISNFCSGMPPRKVHELTFLWFGLPGPLLTALGTSTRLTRIPGFGAFFFVVVFFFPAPFRPQTQQHKQKFSSAPKSGCAKLLS